MNQREMRRRTASFVLLSVLANGEVVDSGEPLRERTAVAARYIAHWLGVDEREAGFRLTLFPDSVRLPAAASEVSGAQPRRNAVSRSPTQPDVRQRAHDLIVAATAVLDTPAPNNHDLAHAARYIAEEFLAALNRIDAETHAREAIQQRHENYANWHQRTCGCTPRTPGDTTHAPAGPP